MQNFELLPSGKQHISFSEMTTWIKCSWRYSLSYVKQLAVFKDNHYADFGTAVHAAIETYLITRSSAAVIMALDYIRFCWDENSEYEKNVKLKDALEQAVVLMREFPHWLEENFPGWQYVGAEERLYEHSGFEQHPHAFKGFIDALISVPVSKTNKKKYWILDMKTSFNGWRSEKRRDETVQRQVILYKHYWSKRENIDIKEVGAAFVILKRSGKKSRVDLIPVSAGPKTIEKHLHVLKNTYSGIKRGVKIKNRLDCEYCEYANTEHCSGYVFK